MKKLALALMCLVSVAFFASCEKTVEHPEPSIAVLQEEGYVVNGSVVDLNTEVQFGFVCTANVETGKKLASLVVKIDDTEWANENLSGKTEYTYKDVVKYSPEEKDIIGESVITAILTDEDGKTATASITLSVNNPAQPLNAVDFEWYRLGNTQTGLEEYGLFWERNIKDTHAQIKPLDGVTLYKFEPTVWDATTTDIEKAAAFADGAISILVYNNVSTSAGGTYDDVIGTKMEDGTLHLIRVTKCEIGAFQPEGYPITISGEAK